MNTIKKGVLLLIVLTMMVSMCYIAVGKMDSVLEHNSTLGWFNISMNITGGASSPWFGADINRSTYSTHSPDPSAGARYYLTNATYQFRFTIDVANQTQTDNVARVGGNTQFLHQNDSYNISGIRIKLPPGFIYVASSENITENGTVATGPDGAPDYSFQTQTLSDGSLVLNWTRSDAWPLLGLNGTVSDLKVNHYNHTVVVFNVTINGSNATAGAAKIEINISFNGTKAGAEAWQNATGNDSVSIGNITLDFTAPVLATANVTASSLVSDCNINLTFTETNGLLNNSGLATNNYNITLSNGTEILIRAANLTSATQVCLDTTSVDHNITPKVNFTTLPSDSAIRDYAGNRLVNTSVTAIDGIFVFNNTANMVYNHTAGTITLTFNESVGSAIDVNNIRVKGGDLYTADDVDQKNITLNGASVSVIGTVATISLSTSILNNVSGWRNDKLNMSILGAVNDSAKNTLNLEIGNAFEDDTYENDTANATLSSATINLNSNEVNFTFSETMDCNAKSPQFIVVLNSSVNETAGVNSTRNMTGADSSTCTNGTTFTLKMAQNTLNYIKKLRTPTLLRVEFEKGSVFTDLAGNGFNVTSVNLSSPYLFSTIVADTTGPTIKNIIYNNTGMSMNNRTYGNGSNFQVYVNFSEVMYNVTNNVVLTFITDNSSAVTVTVAGNWTYYDERLNHSVWRGFTTINRSMGDGIATITVSGATDLAGNVMTSNTSVETFDIDTFGPEIVRAWYDDVWRLKYNDSETPRYDTVNNRTNDSLYIQFNENITTVGEITNFTFKLPVTSNNINGTLVSTDVSFFGKAVNNTLRWTIGNRSTTLVIRGVYSPGNNKNGSGNASGIDIANETAVDGHGYYNITDWAGNPARQRSVGPVDIADARIDFVQNDTDMFSVPFCVNTTMMAADSWDDGTYACSSYTTGAWATISDTNFLPMVAYKCNFNANSSIYVYTKGIEGCGVGASRALTQGWNLLGVDGIPRLAAQTWLRSIDNGQGNASGVSTLYNNTNDPNNMGKFDPSTLPTAYADPWVGYWVLTRTQAYTFTGDGNY
ncbi:MAG: hypothetical protein V1740_00010 [Candidatus Woesearchaeota archaeon]